MAILSMDGLLQSLLLKIKTLTNTIMVKQNFLISFKVKLILLDLYLIKKNIIGTTKNMVKSCGGGLKLCLNNLGSELL